MAQGHRHVRDSQGDALCHILAVGEFGTLGFQKFAACGGIEE
jgi:hypothetical protein